MHPTIQMIPIEALEHHPENPRKDLGDLKELIASIKESGVMQNLTVVPNPEDEETWLVVIGNRRLEASKAAGLTGLPCIISDMDHKTQLATMMAENMQRVDLTLTEQAQGVQLMMDLGMDAKEISKRTGLRKDAVERRAVMAKYDTDKVAEAIVRGGTISDFIKLEKVPEEHRESLLQHVGTVNLDYYIRKKVEQVEHEKNAKALIAKLDAFATKIERNGYVGSRAVRMIRVDGWWRVTAKAVEAFRIPDDVRDVHYYWLWSDTGDITLYKEWAASDEESAAQELAARKRAYRDQQRSQLKELGNKLADKRLDFLENSDKLHYDLSAILRAYVIMVNEGNNRSSYSDEALEELKRMSGLTWKERGYAARVDLHDLKTGLETRLLPTALAMIWGQYDRDVNDPWREDWQGPSIEYHESKGYDILYETLTACGYEMDDEEKAWLDGSHELYKPYEEVEGQ